MTDRSSHSGAWYYNQKTVHAVCCPMTTRIKGYPFEVPIAGVRASVVLADQVKNLDWRARSAERKGRVTEAELALVRAKLRALIGSSDPSHRHREASRGGPGGAP